MRHYSDDDEYSEQLLDKSTEIWTGAVKKRQKAMQNLTPNYSRSKHGENPTNQSMYGVMDKQLDDIKQKISNQKSSTKQKDFEIDSLKEKISQLNRDKNILLGEIQFIHSHENEAGVRDHTINFEKTHQNQMLHHSKRFKSNKSHIAESIQDVSSQKLEDLPKEKLLELLRSTSEYRSFIDYQDAHKLIFLKELHESSKRSTKRENWTKEEWTDSDILNEMSKFNEKENCGLNYHSQNIILARMREYYDRQFEEKARNMRSEYQSKIKKTLKQSSIIPQDLKEICKIKEGQLAQQMARKKTKSLKKKQPY